MKSILLGLVFLFSSCGPDIPEPVGNTFDGNLKAIMFEFMADAEKAGIDTSLYGELGMIHGVEWQQMSSALLGVCWGAGQRLPRTVMINSKMRGLVDSTKRAMYHELTHCIFNVRDHWGNSPAIMAAEGYLVEYKEEVTEKLVKEHFEELKKRLNIE